MQRPSKDLVSREKKIRYNNVIKQYRNDKHGLFHKKSSKNRIQVFQKIPDHPHIVITGGSILEKTNALLSLITQQPDIDKIYLYGKNPYKAKY